MCPSTITSTVNENAKGRKALGFLSII
jgi:hypothetical protein